jgi:hypothetical protein
MDFSKTARSRLFKALGLVVSLLLFVYVLSILDYEMLGTVASRLSFQAAAAALAIYITLNFVRAVRFRWLSGQSLDLGLLFPITLYHNFLVRILPFKLGEAVYPVLLQRYFGRPVTEGISGLVSARLFELVVVITIGGLGLLTATLDQPLPAVLLLVAVVSMGLWLLYHAGSILRWLSRLIAPQGTTAKPRLVLGTLLLQLSGHFGHIQNPRIFLTALGISVVTYSLSLSFDLWLMRALGLQQNLGALVAAVSVMMLAQAVPVATVSGLGTIESGYVFGLVTIAGVDLNEAAALALLLHVCGLAAALITGTLGYMTLQFLGRKVQREPVTP